MNTTPLAYSKADAAAACGVSIDIISRAIRAGDLATVSPTVKGEPIAKPLILAAELERWIRGAAA